MDDWSYGPCKAELGHGQRLLASYTYNSAQAQKYTSGHVPSQEELSAPVSEHVSGLSFLHENMLLKKQELYST